MSFEAATTLQYHGEVDTVPYACARVRDDVATMDALVSSDVIRPIGVLLRDDRYCRSVDTTLGIVPSM